MRLTRSVREINPPGNLADNSVDPRQLASSAAGAADRGSDRMRTSLLALGVCVLLLGGGTCTPLFLPRSTEQVRGTSPRKLALSLLRPTADREVPLGTKIEIEFTVANLTGGQVVATVLLRDLSDGSEIVLEGGILIDGASTTHITTWDTAQIGGGQYRVRVEVSGGGVAAQESGSATITVNTPPSLEFLEPSADVRLGDLPPGLDDPNSFDPNNPIILIRWSADDPDGDGQLQIGLDGNSDHTDGDEIILYDSLSVSDAPLIESRDWDGNDSSGQRVEAGTYTLFAKLSDNVNDDVFVEAPGRITVPPEPNEPQITLEFKSPADDTDLHDPNKPVEITWTLDEPNDVLVDIKIDTDDNHRNGNERTILAQRLIDKNTTEQSFNWNGDDSDGNPVPEGIYRIFLVLNRGTPNPTLIDADGLVFKRDDPNQPLIALLEPASDQSLEAGAFLLLRWRDDDPSGNATIRLELDDDDQPGETTETGDPPRVILTDREASGDGILDTFSFQVPADLAPGRYWFFAFIGRPGQGDEHSSVAAGQLRIPDPNQP